MSGNLQPNTLIDIVINNYSDRVCQICDSIIIKNKNELDAVKTSCLQLESEIWSLPVSIADRVTNKILQDLEEHVGHDFAWSVHVVEKYVLNMLLKAIIHPKVQVIKTSLSKYCYKILENIHNYYFDRLSTFNNLKVLNIGHPAKICSNVLFPASLEEFSVKNAGVIDLLLENLARTCRKLKYLNVNDNIGVTDNSIEPISKFACLKTLCIAYTFISSSGLLKLLVLMGIYQNDKPLLRRLEYHSFIIPHFNYLHLNFPEIEHLEIFSACHHHYNFLSEHNFFKEIGLHLESETFEFECLPENIGSKLVYLKIDCDLLHLCGLEKITFPVLKNLSIVAKQIVYDPDYMFIEPTPGFLTIENLEIFMRTSSHLGVVTLLARCRNLRNISVTFFDCPDPFADIIYVLEEEKHAMKKLEKLTWSPPIVSDADSVAENLVKCCPNLKVVDGVYISNRKKYQSVKFVVPMRFTIHLTPPNTS